MDSNYVVELHKTFEKEYQPISESVFRVYLSNLLSANRRDHKNKMPKNFPKKELSLIFSF